MRRVQFFAATGVLLLATRCTSSISTTQGDSQVAQDLSPMDSMPPTEVATGPDDAGPDGDFRDASMTPPDILDLSDVPVEPLPDVVLADVVPGPEIQVTPHGFRRLLVGPGFTILRGGSRRPLGWGSGLQSVFANVPVEVLTRATTLDLGIEAYDFQFGGTFNCRQTYRMRPVGTYERQCWGDDSFRQLRGRRGDAGYFAPIQVGGGYPGTFWLGHSFTCDPSECFGIMYNERPATDDPLRVASDRSNISAVTVVTKVATHFGAHHACFYDPIPRDEVTCMGVSTYGEVGIPRTIYLGSFSDRFRVSGINQVESLAVGPNVSYAVRFDGTVWCWGRCPDPISYNATSIRSTPRQVPGLRDVAEVVVGSGDYQTACARTRDGHVRCWGSGSSMGLPGGTRDGLGWGIFDLPELVEVVEIAGGDGHFCALTRSNDVWCWGRNREGAARPGGAQTGGALMGVPPARVFLPT